MLASGCGTDQTAVAGKQSTEQETQNAVLQEETREVPRTAVVMVYMVGSNLESEGGMASLDIAEIAASDFDEGNMKVLICTGGASQWWIDGIPDDECTVFEVSGETINPVYTLDNKNMADAATLREFINYGYLNYEAGYYDLILWNHGGGAVSGSGIRWWRLFGSGI